MGIRKKLPNSPVRREKIQEALDFLHMANLDEASNYVKIYNLFVKRTKLVDGLSLNEIAIILRHSKKDIHYDEETNKITPTPNSWRQGKQEVLMFRKNRMKHGILLYSVIDPETGAYYYINISTLELWHLITNKMDKIVKGMKLAKKEGYDLLNLTRKERNRLMKLEGDRLRRELMKKLAAKLNNQRKKELEEIIEAEDKKQREQEEGERGGENQ